MAVGFTPSRVRISPTPHQLHGGATPEAVERVALAVVDLPYAAVRRHLLGDGDLDRLRGHLVRAVPAVLTEDGR